MATLAPARSLGPAVAAFFEGCFRHTKGPAAGQPFRLESWQRHDMDLVCELDGHGRRVWREVTYGIPRGNGKSPWAAGLGLFGLMSRRDSPDVFVGAGSRQQAGIVQGFAASFAEGGPLRDHVVVQRNAILAPAVSGVMRTVSADGDLQHGLSISDAIVDEWHVWKTRKQTELYYAFLTATQKREDSFLAEISTAGESLHTLCGERFQDALTWPSVERLDVEAPGDGCLLVCRNPASGQLLVWRGAPDDADITDPRVWRACNPASWIPDRELERMARTVPERVFRRLILNQWSDTSDVAITGAVWDACRDEPASRIPEGADVWVGLALSEQGDTGTLAVVGVGPRRPVQFLQVEAAPGRSSCADEAQTAVRVVAERWRLRSFAYNPLQFSRKAEELRAEGVPLYRGPKASQPGFSERDEFMVPASQGLLEDLEQLAICHDGDPLVRREVLSARARVVRDAWRIVRPPRDEHEEQVPERAEAAVALVMALDAAKQPGPHVFAGVWS